MFFEVLFKKLFSCKKFIVEVWFFNNACGVYIMALLKYRDYDKYVLKCLYNAIEPININDIFNIVKDYTNT